MPAPLTIIELLARPSPADWATWRLLTAAAGLSAQGHRVLTASRPHEWLARHLSARGARLAPLPLRGAVDVLSMARLARLIRSRGVRVVHAHDRTGFAVALGARSLGGRFALVASHPHGFRPAAPLALAYARRCSVVLASCRTARETLIGAGVPAERVEVCYAGVDERFLAAPATPWETRDRLGLPTDERLVVHVGMEVWEGWKETLQAFAAVRAAFPEARLLLAGCPDAATVRAVENVAHEMGLGASVTALGRREDLADIIAASDVVVDAAWAGRGMPEALRDAMALGRPVIGTICGGTPELIEDGLTGMLVPPRDVPTLGAAITRLLREPELAAGLAWAGQDRVLAAFSPAAWVAHLEQVYVRAADAIPSPDR